MEPKLQREPAPSPERLLFVISLYSAANTNTAGHCYSLHELSTQFARAWPNSAIEILVIGDVEPVPLRDAIVPVTRIDFTHSNAVKFVRDILDFGDRFAPTHIHSFDNKSHFFARWIARRTGAKTYLTKPGGPNPGRYFPYASDIVCFSEENLKSLQPRPPLRGARFHYLPQRVSTPVVDAARIDALRAFIGPGDVLLRIGRIGPFHERSIRQTFALAKALREAGRPIRAVVIGTIQSQETRDQLTPLTEDGDIIINDPAFTHGAAALVPIATGVVGAGRSLIEAALLGQTIFTPVADGDLPVLVTLDNWRHLSSTNFSARTPRPTNPPGMQEIVEALGQTDKPVNDEIRSALSLDAAIPRYASMYEAPQAKTSKPFDFMLNSLSVLSKYVPSKRKRAA